MAIGRRPRTAQTVLGEVKAMDVVERIKREISSQPVVLFMKGTPDFPQCGFSARTVGILRSLGAEFKAVNIFEDPELREELKRYSNWPTYPQLYVNGELLGGCDIALEMYDSGELKKVLEGAGALGAAV
jgi:monothiol glutaredoxin